MWGNCPMYLQRELPSRNSREKVSNMKMDFTTMPLTDVRQLPGMMEMPKTF